jgi:putative tryptophan/tyrosine transport system substrate-binding protein
VINRRKLVQFLPMACAVAPAALIAAEPKVIGVLNPYSHADIRVRLERLDLEMFRLGYVKGKDYLVAEVTAEGRDENLAAIADDLVKRNVDVILVGGTNAVLMAHKATSTIPIVFVSVSDPVGVGLASSLAHPGRNLTGVSSFVGDLSGKRLDLLKQMVPGLTSVAVLLTARMPNYPAFMPRLRNNAEALGLALTVVEAPLPPKLEQVFETLATSRAQAIYETGDPNLWAAREQIAALALHARLPTSFAFVENVEAGGLMSYGADTQDWIRQSAIFIDKIFKGAKPGDLPIELPSKIDLVINTKTAGVLRLKIPETLLLQAARLIE